MKATIIHFGLAFCMLALGFVLGKNDVVLGRGISSQNSGSQNSAKANVFVNNQALPVQLQQQSPQELIPLSPAPGNGQGQQKGQQLGKGSGDCPILILKDGKLYQMNPGNGKQSGPGGTQELIPINPYTGPQIPGLPAPQPSPTQPSQTQPTTPNAPDDGQRS